jgi:hypothetical protein
MLWFGELVQLTMKEKYSNRSITFFSSIFEQINPQRIKI